MADIFQGDFEKRDEEIKKLLRIEDSFDLIRRRFVIGGRQAAFYTVDGFLKGEVSEKVMEFFYKITPEQMPGDFAPLHRNNCIPRPLYIILTFPNR